MVQQDTGVKRKKLEKENTGTTGNRNTRPRVDGDNPPTYVPLGNAQVQRLEKAIPLLEDARLSAVGASVNASAPEMQDYVPRRYLDHMWPMRTDGWWTRKEPNVRLLQSSAGSYKIQRPSNTSLRR